MRRIKILRICTRLNIGGPSLHVVNLAHGMKHLGCDTLLVTGQSPKWEGDLTDYAIHRGVALQKLGHLTPEIAPLQDLKALLNLVQLIRRERPDVVHTHTFKAGLLGRLAAWVTGVPIIIHTYHGHLFNGYWNRWKTLAVKMFEKSLGFLTTRTLAVSDQVAVDIIQKKVVPAEKISSMELGFDVAGLTTQLKKPSTLRQRLDIASDHVVIAISGRLVPIKNVDLFLKAMQPLVTEQSNIHLVIMGDGPERDHLEKLTATLYADLSHRVHFTGWISDLPTQFQDIDVYVCTSKNEGTSVSVIEAVIAQTPVVSTAVGGMPNLLEGGRWGQLVDQEPEQIRMAVEKVLNNQTHISLKSASESFCKRFDESRLCRDMFELYSKECSVRRPAIAQPI